MALKRGSKRREISRAIARSDRSISNLSRINRTRAPPSSPGSTTTWDTRTVANGPHVVGVAVTDTAGRTASASAKVTVDNPVVVPPAAPSALTARTLGGRRIALSWRDNSTNETGFIVERSTGGSAFAEVARLGANARSYTDSGLVRNLTYSYRVRAFNAAGVSSPSNTVTAQAR